MIRQNMPAPKRADDLGAAPVAVDADLEMDRARAELWQAIDEIALDLEPVGFTPSPPPAADVWSWIRSMTRIATIIDIGANSGDYAEFLDSFFRPKMIYAFEPLASCQAPLRELAGRLPHLEVMQLALADEAGEATFWENDYGPSSSLLHVSDLHKRAFPHTSSESRSTVRLARLDDVLDVARLERDILIKIDVQGVEDRVIRGGRAIFSAAAMVLIEMSFVPMYDRQPVFHDIHVLLDSCGLKLVGMKNQIVDAATGQPLFAHCFYGRTSVET